MSPSSIVRINVKLEIKLWHLAPLCAVVLGCAGCSGFQAAPSISPATFLLPGLGQTLPRSAPEGLPASTPISLQPEPASVPVNVAQAR